MPSTPPPVKASRIPFLSCARSPEAEPEPEPVAASSLVFKAHTLKGFTFKEGLSLRVLEEEDVAEEEDVDTIPEDRGRAPSTTPLPLRQQPLIFIVVVVVVVSVSVSVSVSVNAN